MASRSVVTAKVLQYQTKALSTSTEGAWTVRFENMIADALKLGPLRCMEPELPAELAARLEQIRPEGLPSNVLHALVAYYLANRPEDNDWVVLPVTNFDCYFGNTNFVRKYLNPPCGGHQTEQQLRRQPVSGERKISAKISDETGQYGQSRILCLWHRRFCTAYRFPVPLRLRLIRPGVDAAKFADVGVAQFSQRGRCGLTAISAAAVHQNCGVLFGNNSGGSFLVNDSYR